MSHFLHLLATFAVLFLVDCKIILSDEIAPQIDDVHAKASWNDFQKKHLLEPTGATAEYARWGPSHWNTFLTTRIDDYGTKAINSFVVSTAEVVISDLASATKRHDKASNLFWSTRTFQIYVMNRNGQTYDTYDCGSLFFLAALDNNSRRPVHFEAQSKSQPSSGQLPTNLQECRKIESSSNTSAGLKANIQYLSILLLVLLLFKNM